MIRLENLTKVFASRNGPMTAVDEVSMEVPAGEICVLLGPSGCGKTTTMKMINRLIEPTSGKVFIDGRDTSRADPIEIRRSIGYVIQQIGLFPNKTVAQNISVVPDLLGWTRKQSRERAAELLSMVGMDPGTFMDRFPKELSGGQQQRVGVIRALAADPPVMLMDEPFGAIDPINRSVIQDEFLRIQQSLRKTIIFVSHDLDEAVKMANRIAIFRQGRLEQFATPNDLLARPADDFIEDFLGADRTLKRLSLITVAQGMETRFESLEADDPIEPLSVRTQHDPVASVLVTDHAGKVTGVIDDISPDTKGGTAGRHARPSPTVLQTSDLRSAVSLMMAHGVPFLPCVDERGRAVGVVTFRSIMRTLRDGAHQDG